MPRLVSGHQASLDKSQLDYAHLKLQHRPAQFCEYLHSTNLSLRGALRSLRCLLEVCDGYKDRSQEPDKADFYQRLSKTIAVVDSIERDIRKIGRAHV